MMKLLHQKLLGGFFMMALFLTATVSWGQTNFTLTFGQGQTNPTNSTGISSIVSTIPTNCPTSDNAGALYKVTLTAQTGYTMKITSVEGTGVRSTNGANNMWLQLVNGSSTVTGTATCIASSSSCNGGTTLSAITANETVNAGSSAVVNVLRNNAGGCAQGSGGGYSTSKTITIKGTVVSNNVAPTVANATQTRTYGQTTTPFNISGVTTGTATSYNATNLPTGATINTTTGVISFDGTTPASATAYAIGISATNTTGTGSGTLTLTVSKATQTISGFANISKIFGSADFDLTATGGGSGNPVVFSIANNPAVATLDANGHTIHIVGAGSVNITANQAGDDNYNAGTLTRTLTVTQATQAITFGTLAAVTYGDAGFDLTATGGASGNAVTFSSNNTNVATVVNNTVTIVGAGSAVITANQAGNTNYSAATAVPRTLTVNKKSIVFAGGTATDKVYDTTTAVTVTAAPAPTGIVEGDVVTLSGTPVYSFASANAGTQLVNLTDGYTVSNTNYKIDYPQQPAGLSATITAAPLTLSGLTAANKLYDSTTTAAISGTPVLNGVIGSDVVSFTGTPVGTFNDAEIGTGKEVTITGLTLTGAQAANYALQPAIVYADITDPTKLDQVITFNGPATLTYGDAPYSLNGYATSNSGQAITTYYVQPGDEDVANVVGNNLEVYKVGTITLYAFQEGNSEYNGATESTQVTVNPKTLTITSTAPVTKVYNGTDVATVPAQLNGVVIGDDVNLVYQEAVYENKNAGTNKVVLAEYTISGTDISNYVLPVDVLELTGDITPAPVSVATQATAQNRIYNGTTAATVSGGTLTGVIAPDVVTVSATGTFTSENVANGITVNLTYTLGGAAAANYALIANTGSTTANITPAALTITGLGAENKVYNATTAATLTGTATLVGVVEGDNVTPSGTVAANFTTATVGTGKPIIVTGYALTGEDSGNYSVSQPTGITANITVKTITADITNAAVTPKTYNAASTATLTGVVLNGVETGDVVNATTGVYTSVNADTAIPVTISLTGGAANNYTLTQPNPGLTGTINKKALTATADNKNKTVGTGNAVPALTITYSGFISGETQLNATGFVVPTATTTATNTSAIGAYPIALTGGTATNYDIALTNGWVFVNPSATFENILIWSFSNETNSPLVTSDAGIYNTNLDSSATLTRGPGAGTSPGQNSFRTTGFGNDGIAVTNQDYFQFVASADPGFSLSLKTITAKFVGTSTYAASPGVSHQFAYSLNGTTFTLVGTPTVIVGTGDLVVDFSGVAALQNVAAGTTVTLRYYASGQTNTGGWGFSGGNGLVVNGSLTPAPAAPQITSSLAYGTDINAPGSYTIQASGDPTITLSASNLPAGATANNAGVITFDGTTPVGSYNIGLTASSYFGTNSKTLVYTVSKLNQVVTLNPDPLPVKQVGDAPFLLAYSNTSGLAVNWSSSQTGVATIDAAGNITITGPGTTTITASNAGNETYNTVSVTRTLTVRQFTVTPSPITTLHAYQGQPQSINPVQLTQVTGNNLTPATGNITVTASTGFVVSTNNQTSYGTSGTIAYTGGAIDLTNPNIFVKLNSGLTVGTYNGTLTFTGGGITTVVNLTGTVETAPSITITAASYGPYCVGTTNTVSLSYTTQGNFGTGSFYVQHSDATGTFPTDFTNIISNATTSGPISATLPATLITGNYRIRVVHVSSTLLLTGSANDNGSDIAIIAIPTLASVSTSATCSGANADIVLNGLTQNASFAVNYTVNGSTAQQVTVLSNGTGSGSFAIPVTNANNGQQVVITSLTRNDVTAACTQTFSTNNSTAIIISGSTWTGTAANHDWNDAANWSCGEVPTLETAINIAPSASNPEIEDTTEVTNITVSTGATITVKTGTTLTVQGALVNNGQIIVENNAALVQSSTSAYSGNGTATVTRNSNSLYRLDYTLWGSPVTGQQLHDFSPNTATARFYTYAFNWNVATSTNKELYFTESNTNNFTPGKAYLIRTPDFITGTSAAAYTAGTATYTHNGTFNGTLNNGTISLPTVVTSLNGDGDLSQSGHYIAVANPYPSPISVKEFFEQNSTVIEAGNGIYFWRKKNDALANTYAHLSLMGYTSNGPVGGNADPNLNQYNNGNGSTFNDSWILSPAQGFLVKLKTGLSNTATVNFTNSMRKPAASTQPFFKTANTNDAPAVSRLWINIANANNSAFSQAAVGYLAEGTLGLDYGYDARMLGDGNARLYSREAGANLAIQARPGFTATDIVPMGFVVTAPGQYSISLDHVDGVFSAGQEVYLKDNLAGTVTSLSQNPYTFSTEAGTFDTRFEVIYMPQGELGIDNPEINNNVVIYQEGKELKIASSLMMESINVFDMLGRVIYTEKGINATEFAKTFTMAQEVAIVKVTLQNGTTISKKVIIK